MVIMSDFNSVVDVNLDRLTKSRKNQPKPNSLLGWLERQEFKDAFRLINPESKEVSWSSRGSGSRIDYIWITEELANGLYEAEIQLMDICTNSDHNAVVAKIELDHLITPYSAAKIRKENMKRTVIMYDKATKEDWDNYRQNLDKQLEKKISIQGLERFSQLEEDTRSEKNINK